MIRSKLELGFRGKKIVMVAAIWTCIASLLLSLVADVQSLQEQVGILTRELDKTNKVPWAIFLCYDFSTVRNLRRLYYI